eukprot:NODE_7_length_48057_cov_0.322240.p27 type:complete len:133 gc:universal NODE_7_length_48057_cov_0.322240:16981-16583(-)
MQEIMNAMFVQLRALPIVSQYLQFTPIDVERISYAVQVLRINPIQFCQTIIYLKRLGNSLDGKLSDVFLACYLLVNKLNYNTIPNKYISAVLVIPCVELINMELQVLTTLESIRIRVSEVQQVYKLISSYRL